MDKLIQALLIALFVAGCSSNSERETLGDDYPVIRAEAISGENYIRSMLVSNGQREQIAYEVIVDEEGRVISFEMRDYFYDFPDSLIRSHLKRYTDLKVEQTIFDPVIRNGKPIKFQTSVYVNVYPPERTSKTSNTKPPIDWNDLSVTLSRSGCFGTCPAYEVEITGTGDVNYHGHGFVVIEGVQNYTISKDAIAGLVDEFDQANFWNLEDEYRQTVTDNPTYVISFRTGSHSKTVVDYVGLPVGMPYAVRELQERIDAVSKTARWVRGNRETVASLKSNGFDFSSLESQKALIGAIEYSSEEIAVELLNQKVPLDTDYAEYPDCDECGPNPKTYARALKSAVHRNREPLFHRLDKDGWTTKLNQTQKDELLWLAAKSNNPNLVRQLLDRGAGFGYNNSSPLVAALDNDFFQTSTDKDRQEVVRILLAAGVNLEAKNGIGYTALQHAYDEKVEIVKMLLDAGADVNAGSIDPLNDIENTSSSILYITEDEGIAILAIEQGADTSLKSEEGKTLIELARERSWLQVTKLLQE